MIIPFPHSHPFPAFSTSKSKFRCSWLPHRVLLVVGVAIIHLQMCVPGQKKRKKENTHLTQQLEIAIDIDLPIKHGDFPWLC